MNIKVGLELSEEQMQDIVGGVCALCIAKLNQASQHATLAEAYFKISDAAAARGKDTTLYDNLAKSHANAAQTLVARVRAIGHVLI